MASSWLEEHFDAIDAAVFSSDVLFDDNLREDLKLYIGRWVRAIVAHEEINRPSKDPTTW